MNVYEGLSISLTYKVIGLFLFVNLVVGLWQGRHHKTLRGYALADRSMGTGTLAITIIATIIGSKYLTGTLVGSQHKGIVSAGIVSLVIPSVVLLFAYFIFPKLLHLQDCYTLGDIIGKLYGRHAQIFTGIVSLLASIIFMVAQLIGIGSICQSFHLSPQVIIVLLGSIIIAYTCLGGIRSVAATDVLQFLCVLVGFIFIVYRIFQVGDGEGGNIGSVQHLIDLIQKKYDPTYLAIFKHKRFWNLFIGSLLTTPFILFSPPIINRILVARDVAQMRNSLYSFAVFYPLLRLLLVIIGLALLLKHGATPINESIGFAKIAEYFFVGSPRVVVLLLVMLLAVVMSTADSLLNSLVTVVIRDIIEPIKQKKMTDKNAMRYIPYIALLVGGLSIGLSLLVQKQEVMNLTFIAMRLLGVFLVPILLYSLGLKNNKKVFWISVISFFVVGSLLTYLGYMNYLVIGEPVQWKGYILRRKINATTPITLLVVLVIAFMTHIIIHRGLAFTSYSTIKSLQSGSREDSDEPQDDRIKLQGLFKNPLKWATDKTSYISDLPVIFGICTALSWMLPELTTPQPNPKNLPIFFGVRIIGLAICAALMLQNRWPHPAKRYFPLFYHFALLYCLPFSYSLSFLYNPNNGITSNLLGLALAFLVVLVDRATFYLFTATGMGMACIVAYLSPVHISITTPALWQTGINLLAILGLSVVFSYCKKGILKHHLRIIKIWISGYDHSMRNQLTVSFGNLQAIQSFLGEKMKKTAKNGKEHYTLSISQEEYKAYLVETVDQGLQSLKHILQHSETMIDLIKEGQMPKSSMRQISLIEATEKAFLMLPNSYRELLDIQLKREKDFKAFIHPVIFAHIIANLIKKADRHGEASKVTLGCDPIRREFYVQDNGNGIPPHIEPYVLHFDANQSSTSIGLPLVRRLIEMMGGSIRFKTSLSGTTFFIHFPKTKR